MADSMRGLVGPAGAISPAAAGGARGIECSIPEVANGGPPRRFG